MRALALTSLLLVACGPAGPLWEKSDTKVTDDLNALHGLGANDVWAVGNNDTILRFRP